LACGSAHFGFAFAASSSDACVFFASNPRGLSGGKFFRRRQLREQPVDYALSTGFSGKSRLGSSDSPVTGAASNFAALT